MGQNQFAESLVEVMLSWMRWLTSWFWNIVNSGGTGGGFLAWFSDSWKSLTVFLIVVGLIVDWLVWMIRWRPYWLWLRKRQIIYEEVPVRKKRKPRPVEEDPFEDAEAASFEAASPAAGDEPQQLPETEAFSPPAAEDDLSEWDSTEDPYSQTAQPVIPEPDASPETPKKVHLTHSRPVLGERMNHTNVDDGYKN